MQNRTKASLGITFLVAKGCTPQPVGCCPCPTSQMQTDAYVGVASQVGSTNPLVKWLTMVVPTSLKRCKNLHLDELSILYYYSGLINDKSALFSTMA